MIQPGLEDDATQARPDDELKALVILDRQPQRVGAVDEPVLVQAKAALVDAQRAFDDPVAALVVDDVAEFRRARLDPADRLGRGACGSPPGGAAVAACLRPRR